jgi:SAM-dependent methyltransferase
VSSERFKRQDAASYDLAADAFDRLSRTYSQPFADELFRITGAPSVGRVLDLGAGTGIVSSQWNAAGVHCVAADLSPGMLRIAFESSPAVLMDAEAFAIRAGSLDAVVSLFAMMHFPAPETVLRACFAALKPGGVLAFAFGAPAPWPGAISRIPRALLDRAITRAGRMLTAPQALVTRLPPGSDESETPLARRARAVNELLRLTREAGFTDLQTGWMGRRFEVPSAEEFWELQAVFSSRARKGLAALDLGERAQIRDEFLQDAKNILDRGGSLLYPVGAAWIRAKKPLQ